MNVNKDSEELLSKVQQTGWNIFSCAHTVHNSHTDPHFSNEGTPCWFNVKRVETFKAIWERVSTDRNTDDAEARADFWSIQSDFIYRHHNEPRV